MKRKALGRGLRSLIPQAPAQGLQCRTGLFSGPGSFHAVRAEDPDTPQGHHLPHLGRGTARDNGDGPAPGHQLPQCGQRSLGHHGGVGRARRRVGAEPQQFLRQHPADERTGAGMAFQVAFAQQLVEGTDHGVARTAELARQRPAGNRSWGQGKN